MDDDGPGIPEPQREAAFKPFASGSATGTGLGLAIARDAVRRHGGEISLEESPLGGLRARVRFAGLTRPLLAGFGSARHKPACALPVSTLIPSAAAHRMSRAFSSGMSLTCWSCRN